MKALIFFPCLIILLWESNGSLSLFRHTFRTMFKVCSIEISFHERLQFIYRVVLCGVKKIAYVLADKYFFLFFFFFFFAVVTDLDVK